MKLYNYRCPECGTTYDAHINNENEIEIYNPFASTWDEFCGYCGAVVMHSEIEEVEEFELELESMSTRSNIGIKNSDGSVDAIYCHWDGYLAHNGKMLIEHYSDIDKLSKLIDLGGIDILAPEIGEKHDFERHWNDSNYYDLHRNEVLAFHRDKGDPLNIMHFENEKEYIKNKTFDINYIYLFKDGEWFWSRYNNNRFYKLTMKAIKRNKI